MEVNILAFIVTALFILVLFASTILCNLWKLTHKMAEAKFLAIQ